MTTYTTTKERKPNTLQRRMETRSYPQSSPSLRPQPHSSAHHTQAHSISSNPRARNKWNVWWETASRKKCQRQKEFAGERGRNRGKGVGMNKPDVGAGVGKCGCVTKASDAKYKKEDEGEETRRSQNKASRVGDR